MATWLLVKTQSPPTSTMQRTYYLGLDIAKHKVRAALSDPAGALLWEKTLPVSVAGRAQLLGQLAALRAEQVLVVIEATGLLHLNWAAALRRAGYLVAVINPLLAHRLCGLKIALRESKTDPIDARALCHLARERGQALLEFYRFELDTARLHLQRLQTVRQALRRSLTNLQKTYRSLLELSFPEVGNLLEVDGVGLRQLLLSAPTPQAIARKRLSSLQKNWMLRPKAKELKELAARSMADPELAQANAPALQAILLALSESEARLRAIDQAISQLTTQALPPQQRALVESIPGFGPTLASKTLAYLPPQILEAGNNRQAATRLQAYMGNDPRLQESGQWQGRTRMSKRGLRELRTAFYQAAFSASQSDPELRAYYLRKRSEGKCHGVALSHLMRILTRRMVAVLRTQQPYRPKEVFLLSHAA